MDSNYIPINLGDPDISSEIAQFIANTPDIANQLNAWNSGIFDQPSYFSSFDVWKDCTPLVDAVNQLCSWEDVHHICLHFYRQPMAHQTKTNYPARKIWNSCDLYQMVFPIQNWEHDQCYTGFYNPLPGLEDDWTITDDENALESFPTITFGSKTYWENYADIGGGVDWQEDQITEIDRVSTVDPYQPFLHNMESIWAVHKINENAPGPVYLTVRFRSGVDLVEQYNLIPK
jgi:hypothetical protein